jgi:hypothetical protein
LLAVSEVHGVIEVKENMAKLHVLMATGELLQSLFGLDLDTETFFA